ncbi:DUF2523 domain-containing protein [Pseudomonas aeruginosa]|uniref:DUF2523 domain-containing protein n=3 Tax=Pseudomonas aeruginosa TaxID=287 RepID=UPI001ADAB746|nr:DUF2523 domain-containing protein [Pseudomonas aeruginosa]
MPLLIGVLLRAIGWSLIPLGWKLLRGLGFTAVAFVGVKAVMDQAKDYVFSNLGGVPAQWLQVLGLCKLTCASTSCSPRTSPELCCGVWTSLAASPACAGPGRSKRGGDQHALSAHRSARCWQDFERDSGNRH